MSFIEIEKDLTTFTSNLSELWIVRKEDGFQLSRKHSIYFDKKDTNL